ncbi:LIC_10450 family protein [Leptospira ilyithenensis]|uniref:Uncharacterized protein n=1 Tax=Leptospira ilyithenensis TaxID=2484901 RepID=A0A4V3JWM2_9LEPT|nr:hypothetical protein [Leptospira ilyithenensis]TGN06829.1 hypothetical protein EHS11_16875 [Leptospira ilyithenensis]
MTPDKGKGNYIRIDSISEIDPNRMSISQINQRFIDKDDNRYALRFNKETRRIEIIKITSAKEFEVVTAAGDASQPPRPTLSSIKDLSETSNKIPPKESENQNIPSEEPTDFLMEGDIDLNIMDGAEAQSYPSSLTPNNSASSPSLQPNLEIPEFRPARGLIDHFIKMLGTYKERSNAIIKNLQASRIFEITGDPSENKNIVGNLAREFESQVFEALDKMIDLHKEMSSYPRPITYYISKAPADKREEMKLIESDKDKLDNLHLFEMQRHAETIIKDLKKLSLQLMNILNLKADTQVKQLQYPNQLMYADAKTASLYFSQDLDKSIMEVENWKKQR